MASAPYKVLSSIRTTQMRSPTSAEDVEELTVATRPSGINFVRNVPYASWQADSWRDGIATIATHIEKILADRPHVIAASPVQEVDQNGLITNAVQFLVSYSGADGGGPFQDTVTISVQDLHDHDSFDKWFAPVVKRLAAAAAA